MDKNSQHPETVAALDALLERLADLLADKLAARTAAHAAVAQPAPPTRKLQTLDELVAQLPSGKKPQTWKAWLYQRTRHGNVPGCRKIGGRLFFDPDQTLPWLLHQPPAERLDLSAEQSLHDSAMAEPNTAEAQ